MRMEMIAIAAALLTTPAYAQSKGFDAAAFASSKMQIIAKEKLTSADWKKFDAALAKCASSGTETAFVSCMNRELKSASAAFSVAKKS